LQGFLQTLEDCNCAASRTTTGASSPWEVAFQATYSGVAADCCRPQGKNRVHKFRNKAVEVWEYMENMVNEHGHTPAHPLFSMALRQLEAYRSVHVRGKKRGRPSKKMLLPDWPTNTVKPVLPSGEQRSFVRSYAGHGGGVNRAALVATAAVASPPSATTASAAYNNNTYTAAPPPAAFATSMSLEALWRQSLYRLEQVIRSAHPTIPKLPSPLHYTHALGEYLHQVTQQAATSAHPAMLPTILEGLDALRQAEQENSVMKSIEFTYREVLKKYLQLINPALDHQRANKRAKTTGEKDHDKAANGPSPDELKDTSL
jgi:hypothetical protein